MGELKHCVWIKGLDGWRLSCSEVIWDDSVKQPEKDLIVCPECGERIIRNGRCF